MQNFSFPFSPYVCYHDVTFSIHPTHHGWKNTTKTHKKNSGGAMNNNSGAPHNPSLLLGLRF